MDTLEHFDGDPEGESAGECVFCRQDLVSDGILLLTMNHGEWCPTKVGLGARHRHCNGFLADGSGEEVRVCVNCLVLAGDHPIR